MEFNFIVSFMKYVTFSLHRFTSGSNGYPSADGHLHQQRGRAGVTQASVGIDPLCRLAAVQFGTTIVRMLHPCFVQRHFLLRTATGEPHALVRMPHMRASGPCSTAA